MDNKAILEARRQALIRLIRDKGRGAIVAVASKLEVSPTYVSRMISDPESKQHRAITTDTALALEKHYPGWSSGIDTSPVADIALSPIAEPSPAVHYQDRAIATAKLHALADKLNEEGLSLLMAYGESLLKAPSYRAKRRKDENLPVGHRDLSGLAKIKRNAL